MQKILYPRWLIAAGVLGLVVAGVSLSRDQIETPIAQAGPLTMGTATTEIADVVEKALPSVVNISTMTAVHQGGPAQSDPFFNDPRSPFFGQPGGRPGKRYGSSLGSGVIISTKGYVVTNSHVVSKADKIRVSLADGRQLEAEVVGADPPSDLAVLKLRGDLGDLQPIDIGASSDMRLGDIVLAIGNPFGVGQTVTMGIVSAKGRSGMGIVSYEDFIQTDAAINPGNSGGALINMKGQLIGINTAILSRTGGYQGIGFAIPSDMFQPIVKDLVDDGVVARGWLGIDIRTFDHEMARNRSMPDVRGVLVVGVIPRSPAARFDLKSGDVIVRIDGKDVTTAAQLRNAVAMAGPGTSIELAVMRDGRSRTVEVELGDRAKAEIPRRR
ncbi:MAG: trypsin-like peptidase domain-containing protein [Proteobacteria bacterium]|nr:trypsin-like peptidase domain-containing protein [Pseudomonadota bacterium]